MGERAHTRRGCDDPSSGSEHISERLAMELLHLTPLQLENYWRCEVLTAPTATNDRTLYLRAEIKKLQHTLDVCRHAELSPYSHAGHMVFPKVKMRFTQEDCAPPSTWWYQARAIANTNAVENKHAESPYRFRTLHSPASDPMAATGRRGKVSLE